MKIPRTIHCALGINHGINHGIKIKNADLDVSKADPDTPGQTSSIVANAFDFAEAVELPPVCGKIEIVEASIINLVPCEGETLWRHSMDGMQVFQCFKQGVKIILIHGTADTHIPGHKIGPMRNHPKPSGKNKFHVPLMQTDNHLFKILH